MIVAADAIHGLEVRRGAPPSNTRPAPTNDTAATPDQTTLLELT